MFQQHTYSGTHTRLGHTRLGHTRGTYTRRGHTHEYDIHTEEHTLGVTYIMRGHLYVPLHCIYPSVRMFSMCMFLRMYVPLRVWSSVFMPSPCVCPNRLCVLSWVCPCVSTLWTIYSNGPSTRWAGFVYSTTYNRAYGPGPFARCVATIYFSFFKRVYTWSCLCVIFHDVQLSRNGRYCGAWILTLEFFMSFLLINFGEDELTQARNLTSQQVD